MAFGALRPSSEDNRRTRSDRPLADHLRPATSAMTIKIELEWRVQNLLKTAEHFLTTKQARQPVGYDGDLTTVEQASEFLLGRLERTLQANMVDLGDVDTFKTDCFVIYRPIWAAVRFSGRVSHEGADRVTGGSGAAVRQHGALMLHDTGVVGTRTLDLPSAATRMILAEVDFLAKL